MRFRRARRRSSWLDMSPLIDCVLQLLIFFMLSSTFASPKLPLELPAADAADDAASPDDLVLSVLAGGRIFVGHRETALADLEGALSRALEGRAEPRVTFRGDAGVPLERAFRVLAAARRAGVAFFDIAYEPEAAGDP